MRRDLRTWEKVGCYGVVILILLLVLSPHIGLTLLSFGTVWSFAVIPDGFTFDHYTTVFDTASQYITNTPRVPTIPQPRDYTAGDRALMRRAKGNLDEEKRRKNQ